jgi:UDP:flavonoid glycosyltransferase YjiC (YdhE family)
MSQRNPEALTDITVKALKQTNQRGILISGWGGLRGAHFSDEIFITNDVPHDWLFPQTAAVVHHGGGGTTAAGLRAGVPNIVVPFFADQPFWGRRVADMGVGPEMIPRHELTVENLTAAIREAMQNAEMRQKAALLGQRIRAEKGVANGVEAVNYHLRGEKIRSLSNAPRPTH